MAAAPLGDSPATTAARAEKPAADQPAEPGRQRPGCGTRQNRTESRRGERHGERARRQHAPSAAPACGAGYRPRPRSPAARNSTKEATPRNWKARSAKAAPAKPSTFDGALSVAKRRLGSSTDQEASASQRQQHDEQQATGRTAAPAGAGREGRRRRQTVETGRRRFEP